MECQKLFGKIVGVTNDIRGMKLLPDPKLILEHSDAIDVF